jgi:hypothetical protein
MKLKHLFWNVYWLKYTPLIGIQLNSRKAVIIANTILFFILIGVAQYLIRN